MKARRDKELATNKKRHSKKVKNDFDKSNFFVKNKDLILRIVFTFFVLVIIRAGMYLTVPGVTIDQKAMSDAQGMDFFQLMSTLGGGSIGKFSILALGVSPYITASIIVQLLSTDVIPVLTNWAKSGERGRKKLDRLTKVLMIPFAIMQAEATVFTLANMKSADGKSVINLAWETAGSQVGMAPAAFYYVLIPLIMLAGSYLMLWIADQITVRGVGNGISIIIFLGIITTFPNNFKSSFQYWIPSMHESAGILFSGIIKFVIYVVVFLLVIFFVVLMNEAERKIPIQQTGSGLVKTEDYTPYLPLKLNNAGVIPVIFASAIISTPITIAQIVRAGSPNSGFVKFCDNVLSFGSWWGIAIYAVLTIAFTFLYAQVQINPEKIAENFKKSGTFIPGIKPGKDTSKFLAGTINRLSIIGSLFLAIIAVLPYIISKITGLPSQFAIGGTGLIICISVAIQTIQQLKGRVIQQSFIDKKKQKFGDKQVMEQERESHIW
ncbi:preprotein translocase subunit SecY [Mesoplasma lactucae ATCC 49193]|uniref:Protein translocase subunit SecY n=1 Tax=Mesoplasma lactucae ATCC 49193 TaxID=81460 RepID=A0A291ISM2_9MOLU|nr:preprotein translocase subunit SecY [Mesoplasma lactucae ATCC 49193]